MSRVLPILFNAEMVQAILDNRKTATRRIIKRDKISEVLNSPARKENPDITDKKFIECLIDAPYEKGDILYVRETWSFIPCIKCNGDGCVKIPDYYEDDESVAEGCYIYRAEWLEYAQAERGAWRPSIHMPKEAARIWLKVTDVRAERLWDITEKQAEKEGLWDDVEYSRGKTARGHFADLWDSLIKKPELALYGWNVNPWVWVIEFERCKKPEE